MLEKEKNLNNEVNSTKVYYKMWGEHISFKQLLLAILVNVIFVVISIIATIKLQYQYKLIGGLMAMVIALVICAIFIRPKRNIGNGL